MKLLAWLTQFFLSVFGITRPRPDQVRTANLIIGGFLLAVLLVIAVLLVLIVAY